MNQKTHLYMHQALLVNCQKSVVSCQLSAVGFKLPAAHCRERNVN